MNISIRNATYTDAEYLFKLANDPVTRENSFNPGVIKWSEHTQWLSGKLTNRDSYIFIFFNGNRSVGTVKINKDYETVIGVTVDPDFRGLGMGSKIIKLGCYEFWKTNDDDILAYVKNINIGSIKSFEKAGFKFKSDTKVNGVESLILKATKDEHR